MFYGPLKLELEALLWAKLNLSGELSKDPLERWLRGQWRCGEFQRVTPATDTLFELPSHMPRKGDWEIPFPFASARSRFEPSQIHPFLARET